MGGETAREKWRTSAARLIWRAVPAGALLLVSLFGDSRAEAQRVVQAKTKDAPGLLRAEEGRVLVDVALEQVAPLADARDCSHLVHSIYASAGYAYPYASSSEIYAGDKSFVRVRHPRAGDVIAWRGHVGIVVDPAEHRFYSRVRTGLQAQDYESAYWRSRGQPRFYRLRVASSAPPKTWSRAKSAGSTD